MRVLPRFSSGRGTTTLALAVLALALGALLAATSGPATITAAGGPGTVTAISGPATITVAGPSGPGR